MRAGGIGLAGEMSLFGAAVLAAALLVVAAVAWWLRARDGAVPTRVPAHAAPSDDDRRVVAALETLGARPGQAELTIVQFSTAFCGPCRATKARLAQLQATRPGLAVIHVDAESRLDAVRALDVRRTPTLFYLDGTGRLIGRSSGAPRPDELNALVEARTRTAPEGASS
jgi:thiol-disulfide isomerase/thioredoxin